MITRRGLFKTLLGSALVALFAGHKTQIPLSGNEGLPGLVYDASFETIRTWWQNHPQYEPHLTHREWRIAMNGILGTNVKGTDEMKTALKIWASAINA